MNENKHGIVWDDADDLLDDDELVVDEVPRTKKLEKAAPAKPAVDGPTVIRYTRGPNGQLVQL